MKKILLILLTAVFFTVAGFVAAKMFPRPPKQAAALIAPILQERMRADDAHYGPGSPEWNMEGKLEALTKNPSVTADTASVILLDYYLGEHNGETQLCAVTSRGNRIMPLLIKYRVHKVGLLKPWYWGIALKREERDSMYQTAIEAIQQGKIIGCE